MVTVTCDAVDCTNRTSSMVRDDSPISTYPPKHYYTVCNNGVTLHFCSARCLLPWVESSIKVDAARDAFSSLPGVAR